MESEKPERTLAVTKRVSGIPISAVCTRCRREFKLPMTMMGKTSGAMANLREMFDSHKCEREQAD